MDLNLILILLLIIMFGFAIVFILDCLYYLFKINNVTEKDMFEFYKNQRRDKKRRNKNV